LYTISFNITIPSFLKQSLQFFHSIMCKFLNLDIRLNLKVSTGLLIFVILQLESPERTRRVTKERRKSVFNFFLNVNLRLGKDFGVGPVHGCILKLVPTQDTWTRCLRDTPMRRWMGEVIRWRQYSSQTPHSERMNTLARYNVLVSLSLLPSKHRLL